MAASPSPPVRRKRLGGELRRLREQARLTCDDVGQRLDCSGTRISRIETGRISARPGDVRELLAVYGVGGADAEDLVQLAREARRKGWWHPYRPVVPPWSEPYLSLESEADGIHEFATLTLPGLVQTGDYARALLDGPRAAVQEPPGPAGTRRDPAADLDRQLALRRERQARLGRPGAPRLSLVISEAALRSTVGGPGVMPAQLRHLAEVGRQPAVTVQVLPLASAAPGPAPGSFTILGFADPADPPVVYLEHLTGSLVLDQADEVRCYTAAFGQLQADALPPAESAALIRQLGG